MASTKIAKGFMFVQCPGTSDRSGGDGFYIQVASDGQMYGNDALDFQEYPFMGTATVMIVPSPNKQRIVSITGSAPDYGNDTFMYLLNLDTGLADFDIKQLSGTKFGGTRVPWEGSVLWPDGGKLVEITEAQRLANTAKQEAAAAQKKAA